MKELLCLWSVKLPFKFNTLFYGSIFKRNDTTLTVGHEDGGLRIYSVSQNLNGTNIGTELQPEETYETKGGPILKQLACDITRLRSNDIIVSDSKGLVTFLCSGRILCRKSISSNCIVCLELYEDGLGHMAVLAADNTGNIYAFTHYTDLWSLRLADVHSIKTSDRSTEVTCVHCVTLKNHYGHVQTYILVATKSCHLLFIHNGDVVQILCTPAVVRTMALGKFMDAKNITIDDGDELSGMRLAVETQVALGCENGAIYLLADYQLCTEEYAHVDMPIHSMYKIASAEDIHEDLLVCVGNSNILSVIQNGKEIARYAADSWITTMIVSTQNKNGSTELIIGCDDNTVHSLSLNIIS